MEGHGPPGHASEGMAEGGEAAFFDHAEGEVLDDLEGEGGAVWLLPPARPAQQTWTDNGPAALVAGMDHDSSDGEQEEPGAGGDAAMHEDDSLQVFEGHKGGHCRRRPASRASGQRAWAGRARAMHRTPLRPARRQQWRSDVFSNNTC
jgi:hypothetical protein